MSEPVSTISKESRAAIDTRFEKDSPRMWLRYSQGHREYEPMDIPIGRELYTAPFIWVPAEKLKKLRKNERSGKWQCYDRFTVKRMTVKDGKVATLAIANDNGVLVFGNPYDDLKAEKAEKRAGKFARISELKKTALRLGIKEEGIKSWLDTTFGKPMKDFDSFEIDKTEKYLQGLVDDAVELRARANADVGNPNA